MFFLIFRLNVNLYISINDFGEFFYCYIVRKFDFVLCLYKVFIAKNPNVYKDYNDIGGLHSNIFTVHMHGFVKK